MGGQLVAAVDEGRTATDDCAGHGWRYVKDVLSEYVDGVSDQTAGCADTCADGGTAKTADS